MMHTLSKKRRAMKTKYIEEMLGLPHVHLTQNTNFALARASLYTDLWKAYQVKISHHNLK